MRIEQILIREQSAERRTQRAGAERRAQREDRETERGHTDIPKILDVQHRVHAQNASHISTARLASEDTLRPS